MRVTRVAHDHPFNPVVAVNRLSNRFRYADLERALPTVDTEESDDVLGDAVRRWAR
jgi:hypothetical protein